MGPGAGEHGGAVVAEGTRRGPGGRAGLATGAVPVGPARASPPPRRRRPRAAGSRWWGRASRTSRGIDVTIPLGALTCVTGVSAVGQEHPGERGAAEGPRGQVGRRPVRPGAHDRIEGAESIDKVIAIDQSPIGRTPRATRRPTPGSSTRSARSSPMTPEARARGYAPRRFSFNVKGGGARRARATGRSPSRCTSCPTSTCPARSAAASATTARPSPCATAGGPSTRCSR